MKAFLQTMKAYRNYFKIFRCHFEARSVLKLQSGDLYLKHNLHLSQK